ncbi:Serine protease inhibitor (serpin family) [Enhygromyxa salina]|uniref:Serine protease inhibitor (Serpin family) n=1 Tax=Enhygromyxa salina TaxID=215803 RepID=A0A0C1ZPB4_9BACT|nr:serpin family protein [Enhygromyxa salina]KIG19459.1 Serine protease inhibitor (serpin family) [Enhygromyxa salina]
MTRIPPLRLASPLLTLALCVGPLAACTGDDGNDEAAESESDSDGDPQWPMAQSEVEREPDPQPTQPEIASIAEDQLALALDFYHALRVLPDLSDEGFSVSSYSVSAAFGMLYGGTTGQSRDEMESTLHFSLGDERQHIAHNWLDSQLAARNLEGVESPDAMLDPVVLQTANGVWMSEHLAGDINPDYLDLLARHYGTGIRLADFMTNPEGERERINLWVSNRTNTLIPALLPPQVIEDTTVMVLVNALYLKAPWDVQFEEDWTGKAPFTRLDASTVDVDMMHNPAMFGRYGAGEGYSAFAAPLRGGALELVFVVPDDFASFEAALDQPTLASVMASLEYTAVDTFVPRFELDSAFELSVLLRDELGMPSPFSDDNSFDLIVPDLGIITDVIHKTVIKVDENGTEAAAATAIVVGEDGGDEPFVEAEFRADKPFLLMIRDAPTQSVLFFGRVLEP